jgi:Uma2 family endonuclease
MVNMRDKPLSKWGFAAFYPSIMAIGPGVDSILGGSLYNYEIGSTHREMESMVVAKAPQFKSFEEYLAAEPGDLPEGRFEYWDGELVRVMAESGFNDVLATSLFVLLMNAGVPIPCMRLHSCEVEVPGKPRTSVPDLTILGEIHIPLLAKRNVVTRDMPPPRLLVEVVSPGDENSENYKRDYEEKVIQYGAIGVPEYWLVDPDRSMVSVGVLVDGGYRFRVFRGREAIVSGVLPGLDLRVEQVLMHL